MELLCILLLLVLFFSLCDSRKNSASKRFKSPRIVSGEIANIKDFPYMVGLVEQYETGYFCGGSIIRKNWVLTAARCIMFMKSFRDTEKPIRHFKHNNVIVRGNTTYIDGSRNDQCDHTIVKYLHYEPLRELPGLGIVDNDIGLIQVHEPFNCVYERVVELITPTRYLFKFATEAGWGRYSTKNSGVMSTRLRYMIAVILNPIACLLHFEGSKFNSSRKLCVMALEGRACGGDTGSPLVTDNKQIGILHWLEEPHKCRENSGTYYVDVVPYSSWINEKIRQHRIG